MTELNEMYPYERDLFIELLVKHLKDLEEEGRRRS